MSGRSRVAEETPDCANEKLEKFSRMQYSYINQVFGDRTVRGYISALYPNPNYRFFVEQTAKYGRHHVLKKIPQEPGTGTTKPKPEFWCSVDNGLQDDRINENDTFCQTYALMEYLRVPIPEDQKEKQMAMIRMYRDLLSRKDFIEGRVETWPKSGKPKKTLHGLAAINTSAWKDTTDDGSEKAFPTKIDDIVKKIKETLDEWEAYGYHYFIGNGKCPSTKERGRRETISAERTTRSRFRGEGRTRAAAEEYSEPIRGRHESRPINPDATERTRSRSRSRATAEEARRSHTMSTRAAAAEEARSGRTWMSSTRGESRSTRSRRGGNKN